MEWDTLARLGPGAFETISGEVVNVSLMVLTLRHPEREHSFCAMDVANVIGAAEKSLALRTREIRQFVQQEQLQNPDCVVAFEVLEGKKILKNYAS